MTVVELRQYTLVPGGREVLIELFERELLTPQEDCGMQILGTFRDLEDAERFVWVRGFPDMGSRGRSLECFYRGPIWREHADRANATMVDSDNVLLLRAAWPDSGIGRPEPGSGGGLVVAAIWTLTHAAGPPDHKFFGERVAPLIVEAGAGLLACLSTEAAENTFPALPVREGEHNLVCLAGMAGGAQDRRLSRLREALVAAAGAWPGGAHAEVRVLAPTATSRLTGASGHNQTAAARCV